MTYHKPLLVAGHGIRLAKAQNELMKVLDLGIPVVTTFNGFDLVPYDHPCFVGRIGTLGTYGGNYALQNCDLLIEVGSRNNVRQVSYKPKTFAPQAKIMSIDIDETELNKLNIWKRQRGKIFLMRQDAKSYLQKILKYFNIKKIECWLPEVK